MRCAASRTIAVALTVLGSGARPALAETPVPPGVTGEEPPCGWSEGIEAGPRQQLLIARRKAKCEEVRSYEPALLERQILLFEQAERPPITRWNLFGLYPRVQSIDHRSQWAGGLRFWRPDLGESRFDLNGSAFWSLQGFQYYEAQAGFLPHRGASFPLFSYKTDDVFELPNVGQDDDVPYMAYGSFGYRWAPKFDYFGTGPDSELEDQADFRQKDTLVEAVAGYRVMKRLTVVGRVGHYRASIGPGEDEDLPQIEDVFPPSEVPGFGSKPDFVRYGLAGILDGRDVPRNPHRGGLLAAQWMRWDHRDGSEFSFDRLAIDARGYLALGHPQRVLAARAYFSRDVPLDEGGRVPFYLLAFLGNSHTLRGYASQRFRGEKLLLLQAEYRIEASPAIEVALFVDSGAVAARSEDSLERFQTDGGVGLRFKTHELTAVRADFAWGSDGFKFLFRFSPSF